MWDNDSEKERTTVKQFGSLYHVHSDCYTNTCMYGNLIRHKYPTIIIAQ